MIGLWAWRILGALTLAALGYLANGWTGAYWLLAGFVAGIAINARNQRKVAARRRLRRWQS